MWSRLIVLLVLHEILADMIPNGRILEVIRIHHFFVVAEEMNGAVVYFLI